MSVKYQKSFGKVKKQLIDGSAAAIIAPYAAQLVALIKAATPTLTGETRDSITSKAHSKFGHTIFTELLKAIYLEYGTEDTPTFAMFRKTFETNADSIAKSLERDFKTKIESAV